MKSLLVVGAESAAGREVCLRLAEEGHKYAYQNVHHITHQCTRIALANNSSLGESLNSLSKELMDRGATAEILEYDIGSEEKIRDLVGALSSQSDTLDALVIMLEQPFRGDILELDDPTAVIESVMKVNYYTPVYFTHAALSLLRKSRGRVILLSSFHEEGQDATDSLYYAARGAVIGTC